MFVYDVILLIFCIAILSFLFCYACFFINDFQDKK